MHYLSQSLQIYNNQFNSINMKNQLNQVFLYLLLMLMALSQSEESIVINQTQVNNSQPNVQSSTNNIDQNDIKAVIQQIPNIITIPQQTQQQQNLEQKNQNSIAQNNQTNIVLNQLTQVADNQQKEPQFNQHQQIIQNNFQQQNIEDEKAWSSETPSEIFHPLGGQEGTQISLEQLYEQQEKDMLEFAEHMGDFISDETFTFKIGPGETQKIILWPGANVEHIRGMFHSQMEFDDEESYVNLQIYENSILHRNYKNQRLGIFNIHHNIKHNQYQFDFKSTGNLEVYFSYEYVTTQKKSAKSSNSTSPNQQLRGVAKRFKKINHVIVQQQAEMTRIMLLSRKHRQKIERYIKNSNVRIISESLIIGFGGMFCLWLLKKQIYEGYQLLV